MKYTELIQALGVGSCSWELEGLDLKKCWKLAEQNHILAALLKRLSYELCEAACSGQAGRNSQKGGHYMHNHAYHRLFCLAPPLRSLRLGGTEAAIICARCITS